jgi:hypothetical protein
MESAIRNFVLYSIRYQILLAQHVAAICKSKVYIFDPNGFFKQPEDTKVEVVGDLQVRTVLKEGRRAVLSIAVNESFSSDEALFLEFVDGMTQKDDIGLYVIEPKKIEVVGEVVGSEQGGEEQDLKDISEVVVEQDLKDISEALEKLEVILN